MWTVRTAGWARSGARSSPALGCAGVITDGSIRDIEAWAPGFFALAGSVMPSHAHVDVVEIGGTVSVAGMIVAANDLVHADRHGAVVIPHGTVAKVIEVAELLSRREKVLLDAARKPGFSVADLREAFSRADELH
jgi:regulator of RNase E activity RraA